MNILDTLKSKVAGIPVWAIALAVSGAALYYFKKKKASGTTTTGETSNFGTPGTIPYSGGTTFLTITQAAPTPTKPVIGKKVGGPVRVKKPPAHTPPKPLVY